MALPGYKASPLGIYNALIFLFFATWTSRKLGCFVMGIDTTLPTQDSLEIDTDVSKPSLTAERLFQGKSHMHARKELNKSLLLAVKRNNTLQVQSLIEAGAELEAEDENGGFPLGWAAYYGYQDVLQELINDGANVDHQDNFGLTALMVAANHGRKEITVALIAAGADVNVENIFGDTALAYAVQNADEDIVQILQEAGARQTVFLNIAKMVDTA